MATLFLSGPPNARSSEGDHIINEMDICPVGYIDLTPKGYEKYAVLDFRFSRCVGSVTPNVKGNLSSGAKSHRLRPDCRLLTRSLCNGPLSDCVVLFIGRCSLFPMAK